MNYVLDFSDGSKEQTDLLGGKGANLAEMTKLRLPVPTGFTITTEACLDYLQKKDYVSENLDVEIRQHIQRMETRKNKLFGSVKNPLLVSVRSGSKFSMPGMMDTILNLGLNDETVFGLIEKLVMHVLLMIVIEGCCKCLEMLFAVLIKIVLKIN